MKIVIVSQYFYPEEFKINDLVSELVKRGHEVTVITGKPNYPSGNYAEGYGFKGVIEEEYKGSKVIRVPLIRRGRGGAIRLSLNYLSFIYYAKRLIKKRDIKADAVFCFEISPITQMLPALDLNKKTGCKTSMWVQDLWPESVVATGNAKSESLFVKMLNKLVKKIYNKTDVLFISSMGFQESIASKGPFLEKIVYAPNWAEELYTNLTLVNKEKYLHLMPKGFIVMFAGNIGAAQDIDNILNAAEASKNYNDIKWVIVGDGRKRIEAEEKMKEMGLEETVFFLGRYPTSEMPSFFVHANAMLISLRDEEIFRLTVPAKTQTYMASGKPILSMASGEVNNILTEAKCGLVAESSDFKKLAENAISLYNLSNEQLKELGDNSKRYYETHFSKDTIIDTIIANLR